MTYEVTGGLYHSLRTYRSLRADETARTCDIDGSLSFITSQHPNAYLRRQQIGDCLRHALQQRLHTFVSSHRTSCNLSSMPLTPSSCISRSITSATSSNLRSRSTSARVASWYCCAQRSYSSTSISRYAKHNVRRPAAAKRSSSAVVSFLRSKHQKLFPNQIRACAWKRRRVVDK